MRRRDAQNSYGELMQLAIRASSIVGGMVIPGLIGGYLDYRWGTQFCFLVGLGLGVVAGTYQLLALARRGAGRATEDEPAKDDSPKADSLKDRSPKDKDRDS